MTKFGSPVPDQNSLTFPDSQQIILKFPDFPEESIFPWFSLMVGTLLVWLTLIPAKWSLLLSGLEECSKEYYKSFLTFLITVEKICFVSKVSDNKNLIKLDNLHASCWTSILLTIMPWTSRFPAGLFRCKFLMYVNLFHILHISTSPASAIRVGLNVDFKYITFGHFTIWIYNGFLFC